MSEQLEPEKTVEPQTLEDIFLRIQDLIDSTLIESFNKFCKEKKYTTSYIRTEELEYLLNILNLIKNQKFYKDLLNRVLARLNKVHFLMHGNTDIKAALTELISLLEAMKKLLFS